MSRFPLWATKLFLLGNSGIQWCDPHQSRSHLRVGGTGVFIQSLVVELWGRRGGTDSVPRKSSSHRNGDCKGMRARAILPLPASLPLSATLS